MSINLTLEKPEASQEEPAIRYTKRIDDLIEDAEIEAEIEAERKVRAKNTKIVAISGVAIGLLCFLYYGIQSQSFSPEKTKKPEPQKVAQLAPKAETKPIPFPLEDSPATESKVPEIKPVAKTPEAPAKAAVKPPAKKAPVSNKTAGETTKKNKAISFTPATKAKPPETKKAVGTTLNALSLPPARSLQTPAKSTPSASVTGDGGYFIQVGAFSNVANANRMVNKLKKAGFTASLGTKTVKNKTVNVVRVGQFNSSEQASSARSELGRAGFKNSFIFFSKQG